MSNKVLRCPHCGNAYRVKMVDIFALKREKMRIEFICANCGCEFFAYYQRQSVELKNPIQMSLFEENKKPLDNIQ